MLNIKQVRERHLKRREWEPGVIIHPGVEEVINKNRDKYIEVIKGMLGYLDDYFKIPDNRESDEEPFLRNGGCAGLDSLVLYYIIRKYKPNQYLEIGSGNSTMFARRAARDEDLELYITSVDPDPSYNLDANNISDAIIREKFEDLDAYDLIGDIEPGDIFFVDSSHKSNGYNDVSMIYSYMVTKLKKGTILHFHDIELPYNYIEHWAHLNEQYFLVPYILAENFFDILFPTYFVAFDEELKKMFKDLFQNKRWKDKQPDLGASFWAIKK